MQLLKRLFDFYILASFHVALAVLALVVMTDYMFQIPIDYPLAGFVFFGTVVGYNFIKYEVFFRQKGGCRKALLSILTVTIFAFLAAAYFFFRIAFKTQMLALVFFVLTILYTIPLMSSKTNLRNWSGVKIYIVAFCWSGVTILLPLINFGAELGQDVLIKFVQRFLLVVVLILIFEIIDLKDDDPNLVTVPQKIGVQKTKMLGYVLLVPFYFMEFFKAIVNQNQLVVNLILVLLISAFLYFAHENRTKNYTAFWAESIPVFWLILYIFFQYTL